MTKEVTEILKTKEELYHLKARCNFYEKKWRQGKKLCAKKILPRNMFSRKR